MITSQDCAPRCPTRRRELGPEQSCALGLFGLTAAQIVCFRPRVSLALQLLSVFAASRTEGMVRALTVEAEPRPWSAGAPRASPELRLRSLRGSPARRQFRRARLADAFNGAAVIH